MNNIYVDVPVDKVSPDFIFMALEELKAFGASSLVLHYGEAAGVDDAGVAPWFRNVRLTWVPCGAAANSVRVLWQGKIQALANFDFSVFPDVITLDEARELVPDKPGYFIYGESDLIEFYKIRGSIDLREWNRKAKAKVDNDKKGSESQV